MGEGGVAKGGREGRGYGDKYEGEQDGTGGEDCRCWAFAIAGRDEKVDVAGQGGEGGLDGIEEHGVREAFGRALGAVRCCGEFLLKDRPRQTMSYLSVA